MKISEITAVTDEIVVAFRRLIPQLSESELPPSQDELAQMIESPNTVLFIAYDHEIQGRIIGALTLIVYRIPTGLHAWIEDVIVDASARNRGVGEALCRAAIERAQVFGVTTLDLTSRPSREDAIRLYKRLGFVERESRVYRYLWNSNA
jgi:ribosomal protein S18 acetylase RimI-like enzyme